MSSILNPDQRREFAFRMLLDVLDACLESGIFEEIKLVSTHPLDLKLVKVELVLCPGKLRECLNQLLEASRLPVMILMSDLPLIRACDLIQFSSQPGSIVIAPGRRGGTNGLLIRDPRFRVDYDGLSFPKHLNQARSLGLDYVVYESLRIWMDVDLPCDLVDLVLHAPGSRASQMIKQLGLDADLERLAGMNPS